MQFAHAGQDGLAAFLVGLQAQAGVFTGQLLQSERHLLDGFLGLRLDRDVDNRDRESHALQHHGIVRRGEGVTGAGVLQADERRDVTGGDFLDFRTLVGMHLEHPADTLAVVLGGVHHGVAGFQRAGIDAHEGQRAVFVVDDLERQSGKRRVRIGLDPAAVGMLAVFLAFLGRNRNARNVDRGWQVVQHRIKQRLHALVLERGSAQYRTECAGDGAELNATLQGLDRDVALFEILFHRLVIDADGGVEQQLAVFLRLVHQVLRDRLIVELGAEVAAFPNNRLHLHQVDNADELVLDANRQLQRQRDDVQLVFQRSERPEEVGAGAVQLVDEDDARNIVAVGQAPVGLGLRLHAGNAFDDEHRAIEHTQAAVHLNVEVDMAGCVDDVDAVLFPLACDSGGGDGDPALALLVHIIGGGVAVMNLADFMRDASVMQDPLGGRGLAGVDMGCNSDIADLVERSSHGEPPYDDGRRETPAPRARTTT